MPAQFGCSIISSNNTSNSDASTLIKKYVVSIKILKKQLIPEIVFLIMNYSIDDINNVYYDM